MLTTLFKGTSISHPYPKASETKQTRGKRYHRETKQNHVFWTQRDSCTGTHRSCGCVRNINMEVHEPSPLAEKLWIGDGFQKGRAVSVQVWLLVCHVSASLQGVNSHPGVYE